MDKLLKWVFLKAKIEVGNRFLNRSSVTPTIRECRLKIDEIA